MDEDERLAVPAFKVMERRLVDLSRSEIGAACACLSFCPGGDDIGTRVARQRYEEQKVRAHPAARTYFITVGKAMVRADRRMGPSFLSCLGKLPLTPWWFNDRGGDMEVKRR